MSTQSLRTIVFIVIALASAGVAYVLRPSAPKFTLDSAVTKPLFPEFKDPQLAARLKITQVKEDLGQLTEFELAKDPQRGIWVIPSHNNYPADAEDRVRDAATALIDLIPVDVVSTKAADQSTYGLIQPSQEVEASQKGIGLLVSVEDSKGNKLAELIIGKQGRSAEGDDVLYFVRKPGQDAIYVAKIDPSKFTTKFEDWIEKNLLKIDSFDVTRVDIHDYTVPHEVLNSQQGIRIRPDVEHLKRRMDASVEWKETEGKWNLKSLVTYQGQQATPSSLGELEELNTQALNDLKNALGNLTIVKVEKKPEGLGADLKAGKDFLNKRDSLISLQTVGFTPWPVGDQLELFAANGELVVATKDGVEYLLRFGRTEGIQGETDQMTRYLMVTARIDESQFTELPADVRRSLEGKATSTPAGPQPPAPLPGAAQDGKSKSPEKKDDSKAKSSDEPAKQGDPDNPLRTNQPEKTGDDGQKSKSSSSADNKKGGDDKKKPDAQSKPSDKPDEQPQEDPAAKEAQRKLDALKDKFLKARAKVATLNFRFGDWYYVVSEDEYHKLHLTRQDIAKESAKAKEKGFDVDAFRDLQGGGLKAAAPTGAPGSGIPGVPGDLGGLNRPGPGN